MNSISSHGAEVRSIRKLLLKYNNMNREELKQNMERSTCRVKLMVGAGDIGEEVQRITNSLTV